MADEPTPTPGGSTGEPVAPEAVSSPDADAALLASLEQAKPEAQPDPDAEFWKQAEGKDFSKAPAHIRAKVEAPFLSLSSKKIEEANQREQRALAILEKIASERATPQGEPPVDNRALLREKYEQGDIDGVVDLVKKEVYQEVAPQLDGLAMRNAIEAAQTWRPEIREPAIQEGVASVFHQNPILVKYAAMNNREIAPHLIAGAAAQVLVPRLIAERDAERAASDAKAKKAVEDYKAQLRGLPTSTSKAGGPTAFTPDKPMTIEEIRDKAWADAGGH